MCVGFRGVFIVLNICELDSTVFSIVARSTYKTKLAASGHFKHLYVQILSLCKVDYLRFAALNCGFHVDHNFSIRLQLLVSV